jgi:DNA-binding transcriptional MerR regulator/GNAT superfamily N-acetyltransferase
MIRIGDFSRLSQTPISTLRYYDEVGLLKPVEVDHFTGYRYYTFEQLARLHRILALKNLSFSLEEIARLLSEDLPANQVYGMLRHKRSELREQAQDNQERLQHLEAWLNKIQKENTMTQHFIRNAQIDTDLPDIVRITNPYEVQPVTVDQVREWFQFNPPGRYQRRLVSVDSQDTVTGYSGCIHEADAHEGHFVVWVIVDQPQRGQGIGSALWNALWKELEGMGAIRLRSDVRDNDPLSLSFAEKRGFAIDEHFFNYELELAAFDETPYLPAIAALQTQGIRFCTVADFPAARETYRKLYELNTSYVMDNTNTNAPWTFSGFEEFVIQAPWFRPEGQFLALDGDLWVGMAAVSLFPDEHLAYNLHTGVLPAYRNRRIATSLKVLAARYAREHGALRLRTDSNLRNAPILAINRKMGYQPQPGMYTLIRQS